MKGPLFSAQNWCANRSARCIDPLFLLAVGRGGGGGSGLVLHSETLSLASAIGRVGG